MGQIYKITNLINGKVYIGQSQYTATVRWHDHMKSMYRPEKYDYPLYAAMRKYGVDNFKLEVIEDCNNELLDEHEIFYIQKYNSFRAGYNQTLGGGGTKTLTVDKDKIIDYYLKCGSLTQTSTKFNISAHSVKSIILEENIDIIYKQSNSEVGLYQLDGNLNIVNHFKNKQSAYEWIVNNYKSDMKRATFYYYCKIAYESYRVAFGYFWILDTDNIDEALNSIREYMLNFGYNNNKKAITKEELIELLERFNYNNQAVAKYCGVSGTSVGRWRKKYGV